MELQYTLEAYAAQLKNKPRTLLNVASVVQKMMKVIYDRHFPNAEDSGPGRNPDAPDSDILTIAWKPLEYIGVSESEHARYQRLKVQLQALFRLSRSGRVSIDADAILWLPLKSFVRPWEPIFLRRMCSSSILFRYRSVI